MTAGRISIVGASVMTVSRWTRFPELLMFTASKIIHEGLHHLIRE
jgi:hypothetical protein